MTYRLIPTYKLYKKHFRIYGREPEGHLKNEMLKWVEKIATITINHPKSKYYWVQPIEDGDNDGPATICL